MKKFDHLLQKCRYSLVKPYITSGSEVLDIGGLDGSFLMDVHEQLKRGVCIDPNIEEINFEKIKILKTKIIDKIPFPDSSFDIITMIAVYEHLGENRERITSECFRVLRDNGYVLLTVPSDHVDKIISILSKIRLMDGTSLEEHQNFTASETVTIFEQCGFRLKKWKKFQLGLNNLFIFQKIIAGHPHLKEQRHIP
jgi:ubiquinone/menaquinone biosynthesis C-methylase UbiE